MGKLRAQLSYANVMSTIAAFIALATGGAYAASELGKNDVKSKHIRDGAVKGRDVAADAVTSSKVANGSLLVEDFAPNQLPVGQLGPPPGLRNVTLRQAPTTNGVASCNPNEVATGGGGSALGDDLLKGFSTTSDPAGTPFAWQAITAETPGTGGDGIASGATSFVICASP